MTEKDLRRLSRTDLLEMMIEQEKENIRLREELAQANEKLKKREIRISNVGSFAEASLILKNVFEAAEAEETKAMKAEDAEAAEKAEPAEAVKVTEKAEPAEEVKVTEEAEPVEEVKAAEKADEPVPVQLIEYNWFMDDTRRADNTVGVHYFGKISNPTKTYMAVSPTMTVAVKNADGNIVASETQEGLYLMPEDSMVLSGCLAVPLGRIGEGTQIYFDSASEELQKLEGEYYPKSTDFEALDISEKNGKEHIIKGKIKNMTAVTIETLVVNMLLRKDGEFVYENNTMISDLKPKKAKVFSFTNEKEWPEYDEIEINTMQI